MTRQASYDAVVDARGLACPIPLVRTRQALMVLPSGAVIMLLATDPQTPRDLEDLCEHAGHRILDHAQADGVIKLIVEKG